MRKRSTGCWPASVCLSLRSYVSHTRVLYPNSYRYRHTFFGLVVIILVSSAHPVLCSSNGNSLSGGVKYTGIEIFAIFDWNRRLSPKQYEIGQWLLWNYNRKLHVADRSVSVSVILSELKKLDAKGQIFQPISLKSVIPFDLQRPNSAGYHVADPRHFSPLGWGVADP